MANTVQYQYLEGDDWWGRADIYPCASASSSPNIHLNLAEVGEVSHVLWDCGQANKPDLSGAGFLTSLVDISDSSLYDDSTMCRTKSIPAGSKFAVGQERLSFPLYYNDFPLKINIWLIDKTTTISISRLKLAASIYLLRNFGADCWSTIWFNDITRWPTK